MASTSQHWPDRQRYRFVATPVDAQVDVEFESIRCAHVQPGELRRSPDFLDPVAAVLKVGGDALDRGAERTNVWMWCEQVDVLGRPVDDAMLADRARTREREAGLPDPRQRDPRHFLLHPEHVSCRCHAAAVARRNSGKRSSHMARSRRGNIKSAQTTTSRSRLRIWTWSATVPSASTAR